MFNARWVDEQHKEQSRHVVKDFANTRDPTMFAATSDAAVREEWSSSRRVIQKLQHVHVRCDVGAHTCLGGRTCLSGTPPAEIEEHGDCVWRSIRVIYGRRKGARSWQEHFDSILRSEEARQRGFTVESHPKCPTLYYVREADGVIELHVDDGHGCGKETIVAGIVDISLSED